MKKNSFLMLIVLSVLVLGCGMQPLMAAVEYIQNQNVRLGIDPNMGAAIYDFSNTRINSFVFTSFLEDTFYGVDSNHNTYEWNQMGAGRGSTFVPSVLNLHYNYGDSCYSKVTCQAFAQNKVVSNQNLYLEQWITLRDDVAQIIHRVKFGGTIAFASQTHVTPYLCAYSNIALNCLKYGNSGSCSSSYLPYWSSITSNENWAGFFNMYSNGVSIYTPGRNRYVVSCYDKNGKMGASEIDTNNSFAIAPGMMEQYTTYLTIKSSDTETQSTFADIRQNGLQLAFNGDFETGSGSNPANWLKATDGGGSFYYHLAGAPFCYDGSRAVCLTAESTGAWEAPYWYQVQENVTGGTTYKIKFRAMAEFLNNGAAGIRIIEFGRSGNLLSDSGIIPESAFSGSQSSFQAKEFQFTTKGGTSRIEIRLQILSQDAFARAWFDSVRFTLANP